MVFSDFIESTIETPICCELKQRLDKLYEFYAKEPEKLAFCLILLDIFSSNGSIEQITKAEGSDKE